MQIMKKELYEYVVTITKQIIYKFMRHIYIKGFYP